MKKESIKSHLSPYSIIQKRKTTINHAFASVLAPTDNYDEQYINSALKSLAQDPDGDLTCVYCGKGAETWDHLVGLVKKGELRGAGHQVGNLVPCCKKCNSEKGSKDWQKFVDAKKSDEKGREELKKRLQAYINDFAKPVDIGTIKTLQEYEKFVSIKDSIFGSMIEADELAKKIREKQKNILP